MVGEELLDDVPFDEIMVSQHIIDGKTNAQEERDDSYHTGICTNSMYIKICLTYIYNYEVIQLALSVMLFILSVKKKKHILLRDCISDVVVSRENWRFPLTISLVQNPGHYSGLSSAYVKHVVFATLILNLQRISVAKCCLFIQFLNFFSFIFISCTSLSCGRSSLVVELSPLQEMLSNSPSESSSSSTTLQNQNTRKIHQNQNTVKIKDQDPLQFRRNCTFSNYAILAVSKHRNA